MDSASKATDIPKRPIPDKSLFRIGEVSRVTATKPFVLRYWETEFPMLQPVKSPKGHRLYRREDIDTVFDDQAAACTTKVLPLRARGATCAIRRWRRNGANGERSRCGRSAGEAPRRTDAPRSRAHRKTPARPARLAAPS